MISRQLISIYLLLLAWSAYGSPDVDPTVDSLIKVPFPSYEARLAFLDSLCWEYRERLDPAGIPLFQERSRYIDPQNNIGEGLQRMEQTAFYFMFTGMLDRAEIELDQYKEVIPSYPDADIKATYYYARSYLNELREQNELALRDIDSAIFSFEMVQDTNDIVYGESHKARGRILSAMGQYGEAALAYTTAKELFVANDDSIGIADILMEQGILYAQIGLFDESEKYLEARYDFMPEASPMSRVYDLLNIGRNQLVQKKYVEAHEDYSEAYEILHDLAPNDFILCYTLNGYIEAAYFLGKNELISSLYAEMEEARSRIPNEAVPSFIFEQSSLLHALTQGDFTRAEALGLSLYEGSLNKEDASEAMLHARFLSEVYDQSGEYEKALRYTEIYSNTNDSILTANKTNALMLYQTVFETKEKEQEIVRLDAEKQIEEAKVRTYLSISIGLLALLFIGGYLIIQLRKARKKLQSQNEELQSLNKMKNKFFGIIGHDLGNPLMVIDAIGMKIRRQIEPRPDGEVDRSLHLLSNTSRQLNTLLDNLLKWARSQNGQLPYRPEPTSMSELIETNISLFSEAAKNKEIHIITQIDEVNAMVDRNAMNSILRNLLSNAVKFTPSQGRIDVYLQQQEHHVLLEVRDSGAGMDKSVYAQLDRPNMHSTRGTEGEMGTGLGLYLIHDLVQLNKGTMKIKSEIGQGTRIRIRLPKA